MKKKSTPSVTPSSGNIFKDLGFVNPQEHSVKAQLAFQINRLIDSCGLKQKEAAALLGVDQPKISALSRGHLSPFSIERLFRYLAILNQDIEIIIKPHASRSNGGHPVPYIEVRSTTR